MQMARKTSKRRTSAWNLHASIASINLLQTKLINLWPFYDVLSSLKCCRRTETCENDGTAILFNFKEITVLRAPIWCRCRQMCFQKRSRSEQYCIRNVRNILTRRNNLLGWWCSWVAAHVDLPRYAFFFLLSFFLFFRVLRLRRCGRPGKEGKM